MRFSVTTKLPIHASEATTAVFVRRAEDIERRRSKQQQQQQQQQ